MKNFKFSPRINIACFLILVSGLLFLGLALVFYISRQEVLREVIDPVFFAAYLLVGSALIIAMYIRIRKSLLFIRNFAALIEDQQVDLNEDYMEYNGLPEIKEITDTLRKMAFKLNIERLEKQVLYDIASSIHDFSTLDELIDTLITKIAKHFHAQYGYILLINSDGLEIAAAYEFNERSKSFLEHNSIVDWVIQNRKPFIYPDMKHKLKVHGLPDYIYPHLCVPLIVGQKLVGVIGLESWLDKEFSKKELDLLCAIGPEVGLAIEVARLYETLQKMAYTDGLTGLYNHRYFQDKLEEEVGRADRYERTFSLLFIDVDDFKKYNDTYGHVAGDALLRELAVLIRKEIRKCDIAARYGGEEFAVILPETDLEGARQVAERIRKSVEEHNFLSSEEGEGEKIQLNGFSDLWGSIKKAARNIMNGRISVTISIGVAVYPDDAASKNELLEKADAALYRAKREGKNRVILTS